MSEEYDICVVTLRHKAIITPRSIVGMLWLQCHFEEDYWDQLSEGSFLLERANAAELVEDAQAAELMILFE